MEGPFVSAPEVDLYVAREDLTPKEKDTRLYLEVRYARGSCLSLPKSSDIFRLKRAYKNLSVDEYSSKLKIYFEKVETNASATRMDFLAALEKLTQWTNIFGSMNDSNIIAYLLKLYNYLYT